MMLLAFLGRGAAATRTLFGRRRPRRWTYRPWLETLEPRLAPTVGLFMEDFRSDSIHTQPGWDTWLADPPTPPPDADQLLYRNDFPFPTTTNGPTATGGYLVIEERTTPTDPAPTARL